MVLAATAMTHMSWSERGIAMLLVFCSPCRASACLPVQGRTIPAGDTALILQRAGMAGLNKGPF
jgi:hypothetical protein